MVKSTDFWIQTTWEGGIHPIKTAPYTKGMLDKNPGDIWNKFAGLRALYGYTMVCLPIHLSKDVFVTFYFGPYNIVNKH